LPLAAINRHVLVVGASGAGKTTTVLTILAELWRRYGIPFLAIEPIKKEYRSLLDAPGLEDLGIIVLGRDDISPLRLNPLAPPPGVRREVHAGAVLAALKMALPLFPPLPQLLDDALDRTYELAGWDYDTTTGDGVVPPTLRGLLDSFETVFEQEGYVGEARNIVAAFRVRLKSLLRGSRGRVLDTVESLDFDSLMAKPVIIELDEVSDADDKAILAAFLLDRIRAAARARGSTAGKLRHVTVVEEAHRLLAHDGGGVDHGLSGDDTRDRAVQAFCEAIRELRAHGEGFVLSTQSPADLARAAIAATGTRIVHRLETAADRDTVLDDLDANALDRSIAARLKQGEAIMRWSERDDPELVHVRAAAGTDSARQVSDEAVLSRMAAHADRVRALLPYPLCTRAMCRGGCDPHVRREGMTVAGQVGSQARQIWNDCHGHADALDPITKILTTAADGDAQAAYCSAVHLAVAGDAFNVRRRVDIRPQLAEALESAVDRE
jgi:DNA helicase HerA-like ATPase